jgi:hypothetical protein
MKIFLHTKAARIPKDAALRLVEAGYIPVMVASLDEVKVIEPLPEATSNLMLRSALTAISENAFGVSVKAAFVDELAKGLLSAEEVKG